MTNHALFKNMHGENSGTYSKKCTNFHIFEFKLGFFFTQFTKNDGQEYMKPHNCISFLNETNAI